MPFEKTYIIEHVSPLDFYGPNNTHLEAFQNHFPKLKIIARGNMIKVSGEENDLAEFEKIFNLIVLKLENFNTLTLHDIKHILGDKINGDTDYLNGTNDVLVHGCNGLLVKARTPNQKRMVKALESRDMIIVIGPAGTGKTYTAVALAVRALKNKEVRKIILTRPAVEAGENLGFLPGDLKDKLDPYLQPLYDALYDMIPAPKLNAYLEDRTIEIAPLAFMRGRTLDYAFVILDEAQNATEAQLKMFLTRMGKSAKFVVTGDITQIDLPKNQPSGLLKSQEILKEVDGIGFIYLDEKDVVRHELVTQIIHAYNKEKN